MIHFHRHHRSQHHHPVVHYYYVVVAFILLIVMTSKVLCLSSESSESESSSTSTSNNKCQFYIAKSTIPNSGLGIFTTIPLKEGSILQSLRGDVCIPIFDIEFHDYYRRYYDKILYQDRNYNKFIDPFGDYIWDGISMGMGFEIYTPYEIVQAFCTGIDSLLNFHPALVNINQAIPQYHYEFNRYGDYPSSVGSYTPYYNSTQYIIQNIPKGGELYKGYGENWFTIRHDMFRNPIPITSDYNNAQQLLYKLDRIINKNNNNNNNNEKKKKRKNKTSTTTSYYDYEEKLYQLILEFRKIWHNNNIDEESSDDDDYKNLLLYTLPSNYTLVKDILMMKTTTTSQNNNNGNNEGFFQKLHQLNSTRSIDYLEKYGYCVDNINVGTKKSTIDDAGHGAFASRQLKKDTIITISPLIVITNSSQLNMYNLSSKFTTTNDNDETDETVSNSFTKKIGDQLVLNYCFGHKNTDILLCPYGVGVNYINHNQTYSNVRIQWPKKSKSTNSKDDYRDDNNNNNNIYDDDDYNNDDFHQSYWLSQSISSLSSSQQQQQKIRLAFEYVATRDIDEGEELFIDYGDDFEQEWIRHQIQFQQLLDDHDHHQQQQQQQQHEEIDEEFDAEGVVVDDDDFFFEEQFRKYISASDWNEYFQHGDTLWTEEEIEVTSTEEYNHFPKTIQLQCHSGIVTTERKRKGYNRLYWEDGSSDDDASSSRGSGGGGGDRRHRRRRRHGRFEYGFPCTVLTRTQDKMGRYWYSVRIQIIDENNNDGDTTTIVAANVPRSAMRWFDKPYTTDIHLPSAFRHWIGLPDHMLPDAWKKITQDKTESKCDLYLAESTIPNAGLGIFTTRERHVGEWVKDGNPAIPLFDLATHWERMDENDQYWFDPLVHYVWEGEQMGLGNEGNPGGVSLFWPGINCAINSNPALNNVDASTPQYDDAGIHRSIHPGAGAFTPYHLGMSHVYRNIPPGGELFKEYGEDYFKSRNFTGIPLATNFDAAMDLLTKLFDENNKLEIPAPVGDDDKDGGGGGGGGGGNKNKHNRRRILYEFIMEIRKIWKSSRTLNALPDTYLDAKIANVTDISILHQHKAIRDPEWLEIHGRCLDRIIPKNSLLENAGHGAFAKRFIPSGTIITASPLIHTTRSYFDMYEEIDDETEDEACDETEDFGQPIYEKSGQQLLLNYCYGHPESSIRLCPYGSGVNYINHNQTLANVIIRWAPDGVVGHNSTVLDVTTDQLVLYEYPCLAFEYIAIRDIQQGEELFLDYGETFEAAWLEHSKNWQPEDDWSNYETASVWNEGKRSAEPLRTVYEEYKVPYPEHLSLRCHSELLSNTTTPDEIPVMEFYWGVEEYGRNCTIVNREIGDEDGGGGDGDGGDDGRFTFFYEALIEATESPDDDGSVQLVQQIPRAGFRFFDLPFSTDMHLRKAFRHAIGIPDAIFPGMWKDLRMN